MRSSCGTGKGKKRAPFAVVKFGSAVVPIYETRSLGRVRYCLSYYREGKRQRQFFPDLDAAKKEARFVAQRIQSGMQHVTDLKPHERDSYVKAVELLAGLNVPLVAAVEEYVQARKLADGESIMTMATEYRRVFQSVSGRLKVPEVVKELLEARMQDGVKRATSSGGPYTIIDYTGWSTSYTDRGLPAGIYYYAVSALNSVGETPDSPPQSIQVVAGVSAGSATTAHAGSGNGTEGSAKAVDANTGTKWFSGGGTSSGWLRIDLGAGNARAVIRYDITSANDVPGRDPKDWQVQGSHDGSNWTTLDTRTGETFASRFLTKQFTFANATAFRYYRLNILSNFSGNASDGIQLAEWELFAAGFPPPPSETVPPTAPGGLVATAGDHAVTLDWADNTDPDIARYTVHRSTTSGGPYTAIATNVTFSSYSDTTVTNGTTYYYVVTATDTSLNESANSAEGSATPQAPPAPGAPTDLAATAVSTSRIDLTWNAAAGAGSYIVKRATTSGGPSVALATNVTTTSYSDTSAAPRITYYYVVSGVNGGSEGPDSAEASVRIEDLHLHLKFDESAGTAAADSSGTDPSDRASLLRISSLETDAQDVTIGFPTVVGKSYRVEKSATLSGGSWLTVADPVSGTGAAVEITDPGARSQPRWFCRIAVIP